jgi:enoyl-CoA hydratase
MRFNQGKSMAEVFATETKAAGFMITHRDYLEGVRARLVDKDDAPRWRPGTFEEAEKIDMNQVFT